MGRLRAPEGVSCYDLMYWYHPINQGPYRAA